MSVRPKGRRCRACHGAGTVIDDDGTRYPCICRESCPHDWAMGDPMNIEVCRNCQAERTIGFANLAGRDD